MRLLIIVCIVSFSAVAQKVPEDFGYRLIRLDYEGSGVEVVVRSKTGEEHSSKPLLLFCQGSMPQPVLKYDDRGLYDVVPFNEHDFLDDYHIAIISKPGIPSIANTSALSSDMCYLVDGTVTDDYAVNNNLDYYVARNNHIICKLLEKPWVSSSRLVVAGHSEGYYIAAQMAASNKHVTHIILSAGNPYGRMASILAEQRHAGAGEEILEDWRAMTKDCPKPDSFACGTTERTLLSFSAPVAEKLLGLKIPVLVCYGTKDWCAPYNDLLQIDAIRSNKGNIAFRAYPGLEHNYFPVDENRQPDYNNYNWGDVGHYWADWLKSEKLYGEPAAGSK